MPASRSGFSTSGRSLNSRTSGRALPLAVLAVGFEAEVLAGSSAGADPRAHAKNFGPNALRSAPGFATVQDIEILRPGQTLAHGCLRLTTRVAHPRRMSGGHGLNQLTVRR